jgi:hypothetical protein
MKFEKIKEIVLKCENTKCNSSIVIPADENVIGMINQDELICPICGCKSVGSKKAFDNAVLYNKIIAELS